MRVLWQIAVTLFTLYGVYAFTQSVRQAVADRWPDSFSAALEMMLAFACAGLLLVLREVAARARAKRTPLPPSGQS